MDQTMKQLALLIISSTPSLRKIAQILSRSFWRNRLIFHHFPYFYLRPKSRCERLTNGVKCIWPGGPGEAQMYAPGTVYAERRRSEIGSRINVDCVDQGGQPSCPSPKNVVASWNPNLAPAPTRLSKVVGLNVATSGLN